MNLTKPVKILIGLATLWFTVYPFLFVGAIFLTMFGAGLFSSSLNSQSPNPSVPFFIFPFFTVIFPLHFCTIFLSFVLMAFYLIHVIRNTKADETIRIILGLGNFFMPFIAMPIYFYLFIWLDEPPAWAATKTKST